MSTQRFTPKCKAKASCPVIESGYSVAETAERLGVSTHSLYKRVKAVMPEKPKDRPASRSHPQFKPGADTSCRTLARLRWRRVGLPRCPQYQRDHSLIKPRQSLTICAVQSFFEDK